MIKIVEMKNRLEVIGSEEGIGQEGVAWLYKCTMGDLCGNGNIHLVSHVNILLVIVYYSFARCYYYRKLCKEYMISFCIIS